MIELPLVLVVPFVIATGVLMVAFPALVWARRKKRCLSLWDPVGWPVDIYGGWILMHGEDGLIPASLAYRDGRPAGVVVGALNERDTLVVTEFADDGVHVRRWSAKPDSPCTFRWIALPERAS